MGRNGSGTSGGNAPCKYEQLPVIGWTPTKVRKRARRGDEVKRRKVWSLDKVRQRTAKSKKKTSNRKIKHLKPKGFGKFTVMPQVSKVLSSRTATEKTQIATTLKSMWRKA